MNLAMIVVKATIVNLYFLSLEQREPGEKIKNKELSADTVTFISYVYRREPGKCCTLPFFLVFFIFSDNEETESDIYSTWTKAGPPFL